MGALTRECVTLRGSPAGVLGGVAEIIKYLLLNEEGSVKVTIECETEIPADLLHAIEREYKLIVEGTTYNSITVLRPAKKPKEEKEAKEEVVEPEEDFDSFIETWKEW